MHGIYLSANNDKEGFRLPVNPEKIGVVSSGDGEEFTISKTGNVNIPKDTKLETYSFESFFPSQNYSFVVTNFREPQIYVSLIKKWQARKLPIRFIYTNGSFVINELVTIEEFPHDETAGSADVNFSLSLKRYVPFGPKKMKVVISNKLPAKVIKKNQPVRQNKRPALRVYTLVRGDSLWKVAQKFLGNGVRYREIQKLNGIKDSQLRKLQIGMKIKLPKK
jgi:LysM repeat protein